MKRTLPAILLSLSAIALLAGCGAEPDVPPAPAARPAAVDSNHTPDGVRSQGAVLGEWTHDWEAAVALARAEKRPLLAIFTASDWNKWHKLLDDRVLSVPQWREWAAPRLVLAWINLPNDDALLPANCRDRNRTLSRQYGASDFPAVFLLNAATRQSIDRYHVTRDTTFADFVSWFNRVYADRQPGGGKAYLSPEERADLEALRAEREPLKKAYEEAVAKASEEYRAFQSRTTATEDLADWTRKSDKELDALRAPVEALDRKLDVHYARVADSLLLAK